MGERERSPLAARSVRLAEVDSTNAEAHRRAAAGETGPLWILADRQTHGRGRSGRAWSSPGGTLSATLLFQPAAPTAALHQLSLVAGVATHEAVVAALPADVAPRVRLKWPNDVLIDSGKVSGILVESGIWGGVTLAAVGIGINVAVEPDVWERAVTSLAAHGGTTSVLAAWEGLGRAMDRWLSVWDHGEGFAETRAAWLERAMPVGTALAVNAGAGLVNGTFAGLDTDGALLLLEPNGECRRFSWGDVTLAPPSGGG